MIATHFIEVEKDILKPYYPETYQFLYQSPYLARRNNTIKWSLDSSHLVHNLVLNDILLTNTNRLKTFYEIDLKILKYLKRKKKLLPLSTFGILKKLRIKSFISRNIIYTEL